MTIDNATGCSALLAVWQKSCLVWYAYLFPLVQHWSSCDLCHRHLLFALLINNKHAWPKLGVLLDGLAFSPACLPQMLTHKKHQLQREPCSLFMQALYLSSWVAMYVIYIFHTYLCYLIYMMLLLYFRPVTEKKTPLLRNHSICSGPQRFTFVFNYSAF